MTDDKSHLGACSPGAHLSFIIPAAHRRNSQLNRVRMTLITIQVTSGK
jgi:hypothetical protein